METKKNRYTSRVMLCIVCAMILVVLTLTACGKKDVSFDTLETARAQAKDNGEFNARKWRADTKVYAAANMISRGDSTQEPSCPQGDGWASVDLVDEAGQKLVSLKCSTVSMNVGCLEAKDFKTKSYAGEEGLCQSTSKVPHPLPKIAK
jgi:hypothetical protein